MDSERYWPEPTAWLAAIGGPMILGAVLGLPFGAAAILRQALALTGVVLGVAALMGPALYVGLSLIGTAPPALQVVRGLGRGLRSCGLVLAGLAPAAAFLVTTADSQLFALGIGIWVVLFATLVGLGRAFRELLPPGSVRLRALSMFAAWAVVALGLGAHLLLSAIGAEVI